MLNTKNFMTSKLFRFGLSLAVVLFVWGGYIYSQSSSNTNPLLQGSISIQPTKPLEGPTQVQPGTQVRLKVNVENKGIQTSAPGKAHIRFAFAKPLDTHAKSVIFQTEQLELPSIEPGKSVEMDFKTLHQCPTLFDFVRQDWPLREYQAVVQVGNEEKVIGTLAMTVSAYYYPGIRKEFPTPFPAQSTPN